MKSVLLIPYIKIQNANALSSPYTIGFPAMTAWLGAVHALQRQLIKNGFLDTFFKSSAVICHDFVLHIHKDEGDFVYSIIGTGNPLNKLGERSSFIEEGRCHLIASLVIECEGVKKTEEVTFIKTIENELQTNVKISGGDILELKTPEILKIAEEKDLKKLVRRLMPGYVIIERRDLMVEAMANSQDALDAIIEYLKVMHRSEQDEDGKIEWTSKRKIPGWIVPIATGFYGVSALGKAENQRDPTILHRFAESILTLGEFKMVYQIRHLDEMLWHYHVETEKDLYLCQQNL
ncbi:type I-F CRISPR-associated protein Csy2 [Legionella maceachernii]|uniref:CRISPR-associated protein Csy2 n=1 Tax=Legionella maceachernii TaxID=466 RepID=A0A0W0WE72_9GAMM|nr:type I-F CRISPR-associated protein Csy2 [Legionella maceachernii]KTD30592.1 CRISPR-associated protein Csy2 [Legionella maceachernii]SJZ97724.1 CRISPR-associated protein, Csy2 family [Legionella maceachernii]SUP01096.1 CRISPR type I-F/YPEST-associated protein Csy2 [Legionella maceachernii]